MRGDAPVVADEGAVGGTKLGRVQGHIVLFLTAVEAAGAAAAAAVRCGGP